MGPALQSAKSNQMGGIPLKQDLVTQLETLMGLLQQYRLADLAGREEESTQAINQCLALVESMSPKRRYVREGSKDPQP